MLQSLCNSCVTRTANLITPLNKARDTRDLKRPRPLQRKLKGSPRNSKDLQERNSEDLQKSLRNPKDLQGTPKNSKGTPKELLRNTKGIQNICNDSRFLGF